ncbi:hypothetical protein DYU05_17615 [Mucilaginibacter terrenus]|uniref:Peptidase M56 domain-containing protein n=1 Tax=Mucilaginibacter terrenus TaxID=2482727 RepID=A0A3E2NKY3_9SPHI|nr:M56 family metallopeptidase [Mucilaginibacter terrenus]RFZ81646.1 hypothetical protein DYU05_17615 [Mucilaginibacter terrenus]
MSVLSYNISHVLGIAILHSLWQGLLIWVVLRIIFIAVPQFSSIKKYNLAVVAILGISVWFIVTLFREAGNFSWTSNVNASGGMFLPTVGLKNNVTPLEAVASRYYILISGFLPYVSIFYLTGLLINLFKLSYCQVRLHQIRKALLPAANMQFITDKFAELLAINRYVQVKFSELVDVPCMIGFLKPVILLPVSLATNLSIAETESILLHELAHIKRNDYLINLLQQIVNSLLFFNPFAQMINRLISSERENCCDDLVVQTTNSPLIYARALLKLEERRQSNLQLALAATTKKQYLLTRIERIMKTKQKIGNMRHLVLAMILLFGSLSSIAWLNPQIKNGKVSIAPVKPAEVISTLFADTTKKKLAKPRTAAKTKKYKVQQYKTNFDFNYNNNYSDGLKDKKLEELSAEVQKHSDVVSKYYDSNEFKAYSADLEKRGKEIEAFYNSDRMKEITAKQEKLGKEFEAKWGGKDSEMSKNGAQMEALGKKVETYFNSAEFKATNDRLKKKYGISDDKYHDSRDENYKKYQAELDQTLSPEIKQTTQQMRSLGDQMRNRGDAMRLDGDEMRKMGESMREAFNNPEMKKQQEDMRRVGDKMRAYANNPEIEKQKKLLRESADKLRAYTQSAEFKAKVKEWRKTHPQNFNWNDNKDDSEKVESTERPEKPEAPEKPEPAEKP